MLGLLSPIHAGTTAMTSARPSMQSPIPGSVRKAVKLNIVEKGSGDCATVLDPGFTGASGLVEVDVGGADLGVPCAIPPASHGDYAGGGRGGGFFL